MASVGAGCVSPLADDPDASSRGRDRDLAERAAPLPTTTGTAAPGSDPRRPGTSEGSDTRDGAGTGGADDARDPGDAGDAGDTGDPGDAGQTAGDPDPDGSDPDAAAPASEPTTTTAPAGRPPRVRRLATVDDAGGDHGLEGPDHADARRLVVDDVEPADGSERAARVSVVVDAALPSRLAEGEVMGIGVDLFRDPEGESEYQLFAEGGSEGWFAYLDTPDGLVDYPGSFRLGGERLEFEVSWSEIGGRRRSEVSLFVDWSRERTVGPAASSQDRAPDEGTATVSPTSS